MKQGPHVSPCKLDGDHFVKMKMHALCMCVVAGAMFAATLPLRANVPYENAPTFQASDFLPESILNHSDYTIAQSVPTDGLMGIFKLHTDFGDFECRGLEMIQLRLAELQALNKIEEVSKTKVFEDAAKRTLKKPVHAVIAIASHPIDSASEVPKGVERLFGRVAKGVGDSGRAVAKKARGIDAEYDAYGERLPAEKVDQEPSDRRDPFGYNKARNEWAQRFGVDPYTSNTVLAEKLDSLARLSFGTDTLTRLGIVMVASPLQMVATVDECVLTEPPATVRKINAERLAKLGVQKKTMGTLFENRWFTPTLQTRFVKALDCMQGVQNASSLVRLAGDMRSEEEARFLCRGVELLAGYHNKAGRLSAFKPQGRIPAAYAPGDTLVVSGPVDVIAWTETIAEYAAQWNRPEIHPVLCTSAILTKSAREGMAARGWSVHFIESRP